MKRNVDRRTCDYCGYELESTGTQIGGNVFSGWLKLEREVNHGLNYLKHAGPWDFCKDSCLANFVANGFSNETDHERKTS